MLQFVLTNKLDPVLSSGGEEISLLFFSRRRG